ncbi:reverse transcriptase domain-containing protein [Tanacetum coccineum]
MPQKEKMDAQYGKFLNIIRSIRISVPLVDVLAGMPNYGKFIKEIVSNKQKLEQISAAFFSDESDLGASINLMPYSLYAKLSLKTLKPTKMSVRLADKSFQYPVEIAKNMLVEVGKFTFPIDFVVLEMEEDSKVPQILGRPFLHTADAVIRVKRKQLNLGVGTEHMTFHMDSAMKHSYSNDDTCFSIDVIDEISEEYFDALLDEEFDIEIKDKKGIENVATDHLSRIENDEKSDDSDVDDNFPAETLMEITTKDTPWFPDFANYLVGWQNPNNNNGWLDEDDDEEPEEDEAEPEEDEADEDNDKEPEEDEADEDNDEEMEEEEDEEEEEIVAEDEADIIYPYDEADPNNRPPPASNDESEFAPSVIPVFDAENRPVPPIIHFSSTYEMGESSSTREILKDIGEVYPLGPVPPTIGTAIRRIRKFNEQMRKRAEVDERIVKKIDRSDLHIWMVSHDAMSLDGAVRECQADVSNVISMMESMSLEFDRVRKESRRALELVEWEAGVREQYLPKFRLRGGFVEISTRSFLGPFTDNPYLQARNAAMADEDVEDDDIDDEDDMDDDAANPSDP